MDISEYKRRVIELFKSGNATEEMWQEMAMLVLYASEDEDSSYRTEAIDKAIGACVDGESAP